MLTAHPLLSTHRRGLIEIIPWGIMTLLGWRHYNLKECQLLQGDSEACRRYLNQKESRDDAQRQCFWEAEPAWKQTSIGREKRKSTCGFALSRTGFLLWCHYLFFHCFRISWFLSWVSWLWRNAKLTYQGPRLKRLPGIITHRYLNTIPLLVCVWAQFVEMNTMG